MTTISKPKRLSTATIDRAAGALLGQAVGDAFGVPYEFGTPPGPGELAEMRGGGLGNYAPGEWSDDTQMATCLALVAADGVGLSSVDATDQVAAGFERWFDEGPADIGIQTRAVLSSARTSPGPRGAILTRAAREYAATHARSAGNGALMRTAIVGLTALGDRERTARAARVMAELTHADPLAGDSCVLWSEAIRVAVLEARFDLAAGLDLIPEERRAQWEEWITAATGADPRRFRPNGYTVTALQAAWAAITSTPVPPLDPASGSFPCQHLQDALHAVIRVGDDTDTIAAIAGGLLGARWGASATPAAWRRRVHGWPGLRGRDLVRLAVMTARGGQNDRDGWPSGERLPYPDPIRPAVTLPGVDGVWLGGIDATDHAADAVVSLCRLGTTQPQVRGALPGDQVEVWLIDSNHPDDNPNLHFVIDDAARTVLAMRAEGRQVLLHCVAMHHRTPSVAARVAVLAGAPHDEARHAVLTALPRARRTGALWDAVADLGSTR